MKMISTDNLNEYLYYKEIYNKAINDCLEIVKFHRDSWDGIEWAIKDIEELKVENENKRSESNWNVG